MNLQSLFTITYVTPDYVAFGETTVPRPREIDAGQWMEFWESLNKIDDISDLFQAAVDATDLEAEVKDLEVKVDDLEEENAKLIDDIRSLEDENAELSAKIEKLEADVDRMDYEMGRP